MVPNDVQPVDRRLLRVIRAAHHCRIVLLLEGVHDDVRLPYAAIFEHRLKDVQGRKSPAHADFKGRGVSIDGRGRPGTCRGRADAGRIKAPAEAVVAIDDTLAIEPVDCCANAFASRLCRGIDRCHGAAGSAVNCHHSKMSACIIEFNRLRPKNCLDGRGHTVARKDNILRRRLPHRRYRHRNAGEGAKTDLLLGCA